MSDQKSAAQKRQVKFSGLVHQGVISPASSEAGPHFANSLPPASSIGMTAAGEMNLPAPQQETALSGETIIDVDVNFVDDSPYQPRNRYDPEELDKLAGMMTAAGQQEPIIVRRTGNRYQLIAGHRRIRAARTLGWVKIRATVVSKSDDEAELSTMVHNEGRENLCDYDKAKLYRRAKDRGFAKTQTEIAALFATSQSVVSKCMAMLELPPPFLALLEDQQDLFSHTTADVINDLLKNYPDEQALILQAVVRIKEGAPEASVRGWISQMLTSRAKGARPNNKKPKVITDKGGRQMFTARLEGRVISVRISSLDVDSDAILEKLVGCLRESANPEGAENAAEINETKQQNH